MSKITLSDVASFQNDSTAVATVNSNFTIIETEFDNTLSRDGAQPNQMDANLDMNNSRILNLPAPVSSDEPARLQDIANLAAGTPVTLTNLPVGGTTGQILTKNSGSNYDASWSNIPSNVAVTSFNTNTGAVTYGLTSTDFVVSNANSIGTVNMTTARKTLPTQTVLAAGTSGTYTAPTNCLYIKVTGIAGGGGGGGSGTSGTGAGGTGGTTSLSTFSATGGAGGSGAGSSGNIGGSGGAATGGKVNISGLTAPTINAPGITTSNNQGGVGSQGQLGAFGSGGQGGGITGTVSPASGGGGGSMFIGWINSPTAYSYTVGSGGTGGTAGTSGNAGATAAGGVLIIEEFYNS